MTVLELTDVRVRYGHRIAVDGVSLRVNRGEIVGLLGPNGSGKSTTLAAAAGVLDPFAGTVTVAGFARNDDPAGFAMRVGLVPQDFALYDDLSAEDNLLFFGKLYRLRGPDLAARVHRGLTRAGLGGRGRHRVGTFSGGMKQRLGVACALLHDPPLLLLDEPTAATDPAGRDTFFADLHRLKDDGHAVLITTHHLDEAEHGCDRVAVLDAGKLVASGKPAEVMRPAADRAGLYGQLRSPLPRFVERRMRERLGPNVDLEIVGRRLRLAADSPAELGVALALVLADGADLVTFRTPPGRAAARRAAA